MKKLLLLGFKVGIFLFFLNFTACSTMYIRHNNSTSTFVEYEEWHHDGILGLVEFSPPVLMHDRCDGKGWETIKIERTFLQGFVALITKRLYDPWMVSYKCKE